MKPFRLIFARIAMVLSVVAIISCIAAAISAFVGLSSYIHVLFVSTAISMLLFTLICFIWLSDTTNPEFRRQFAWQLKLIIGRAPRLAVVIYFSSIVYMFVAIAMASRLPLNPANKAVFAASGVVAYVAASCLAASSALIWSANSKNE